MLYDVVIVGGGPAGLAAALALGRARKRVLVCDSGPRRNAAAERVHNFVTRDGTPPDEFRRIAREQLAAYPKVDVRDVGVESIGGERGSFQIALGSAQVASRRVLLCTGMVDELLPIAGFRELWGHGIFQCPYCHGWEAQDRRWGYLVGPANVAHLIPFTLQLRGWSPEVVLFSDGRVDLTDEQRAQLAGAGVRLETARVARLVQSEGRLQAVELANGERVACEVLFAHPPQQQAPLVRSLALALDADGFVQVDPMRRETSLAGVYAAGDLTTRMQGAIMAAASGTQTAAALNLELTLELASSGEL